MPEISVTPRLSRWRLAGGGRAHVDAARGEHAEQAIGAALRVARDRDAHAAARATSSSAVSSGVDVLGIAERARVIELLAQHAQRIDLDAQLRRIAVAVDLERRQLDRGAPTRTRASSVTK